MISLVFVLFFSAFLNEVESMKEDDKRLLLNDPDILIQRLNVLEKTVSVLNSTLQQVLLTNFQHETTIQQVQTTNSQQEATIQTLRNTIQQYQSQHNQGATFIRWGRKQCPSNTSELIYSGYAGGGFYNEEGSAAEYVCLPPDPDFDKTSGSDYGRMYGAEFDDNFFAPKSAGEDVPCAHCRALGATSVIMIPGKNTCYNGWKREFHGYLASGHHAHEAASSYTCMDINPEFLVGGVDDHNGKLFYNVLAKCGALQCPPYINNYPLTCVVCSK